jgi:hypothetical protein
VGSRLFTAIGVLLAAAAVAGWWADRSGGAGSGATTVVAVVGVLGAACGLVAAVAGARLPAAADADAADVEVVLFAPVSYAAAAVVVGGAGSAVGVAAVQPWLTPVGVAAVVIATTLQVRDARAAGRSMG